VISGLVERFAIGITGCVVRRHQRLAVLCILGVLGALCELGEKFPFHP
jgi:hypothetical protein